MSRRRFLAVGCRTLLGGMLASSLVPFYATQIEPQWLEIVRVTVLLPNWPPALEGFKIALLSDIHLGAIIDVDYVRRAVALANTLSPDLVALTGDFVTGEAWYSEEVAPVLAKLRARYGVYAVLGNHDIWTRADEVAHNLEDVGIVVLRDAKQPLTVKGARLWLLGIEDRGYTGVPGQFEVFRTYWQPQADVMASLLAEIPQIEPRLLMVHNPDFTEMLPEGRVDLALSGHTHGGQIHLPIIGTPFIPSCFGSKFTGGLIQGPTTRVYVTRGIGVTGLKVRFNARPEITLLQCIAAPVASPRSG